MRTIEKTVDLLEFRFGRQIPKYVRLTRHDEFLHVDFAYGPGGDALSFLWSVATQHHLQLQLVPGPDDRFWIRFSYGPGPWDHSKWRDHELNTGKPPAGKV
jgi:hypothetical protein